MKKIYLLTLFILAMQLVIAQNVGINTASPHASAQLDISSTTKGILVPRMSQIQRDAISNPATALLIYQTDNNAGFYFNVGSAQFPAWQSIAGSGGFSLPYTGVGSGQQLFKIANTGNGNAITAHSESGTAIGVSAYGNGNGISVGSDRGFGVTSISNDTGIAIYGMSQRGNAAKFEIKEGTSLAPAVHVRSVGQGIGVKVEMNSAIVNAPGIEVKQNGVGPGVKSISVRNNGVEGHSNHSTAAGVFGTNTAGDAIVGHSFGLGGSGMIGRNTLAGFGVQGMVDGNGVAVHGFAGYTGSGQGVAGKFETSSANNTMDVLQVVTGSNQNNIAAFYKNSTRVARIDQSGKGFFNGGTQNSGADIAEAFDVEGARDSYEPGDVLVISMSADRKVEKSSGAYSTLVAGVYATKPGVLLTEEGVDTDMSDKVPMGVMGVIPTKVCIEGGVIKRGDLLVSSSFPGVAMKGDFLKVQHGQIIGKALENFDEVQCGKINVLVTVR